MRRTRAARSLVQEQLRVEGLHAPVEVRRHPAARRMTLRVSRTRRAVVVTLPMQCDLDDAGSFLSTHLDWVRRHLGKLPRPVPFAHDEVIPYLGMPHRIAFAGVRTGRGVVHVDPRQDDVARLVVSGATEHGPRRLTHWLEQQAARALNDSVLQHARRLGLRPARITVRDQISRWGSCSSTGALSFSWRLIMAPPFILDYVAAHEVAHLAEMNHGPRFWALVARTMPRMDEARDWLRAFGMDLHRYGQS